MQNKQPPPCCAYSLSTLPKNGAYYAVRMKDLDAYQEENKTNKGEQMWPEFLVCISENAAFRLCDYLNEVSYLDSRSTWIEEEPYLTEVELFERWQKTDLGIYEVIYVENIKQHPDFYRLMGSLPSLEKIARISII